MISHQQNIEHDDCDLPFSVLKLQGSPSIFVTSGQFGLVFHVLANVQAVFSIIPEVVLKSCDPSLSKSPHRPG